MRLSFFDAIRTLKRTLSSVRKQAGFLCIPQVLNQALPCRCSGLRSDFTLLSAPSVLQFRKGKEWSIKTDGLELMIESSSLDFFVVLECHRQMRGRVCAVQDSGSGRGSSEIRNSSRNRAKLPGLWCYIRLLCWQWEQGQGHVMIPIKPVLLKTVFKLFFLKSKGQK